MKSAMAAAAALRGVFSPPLLGPDCTWLRSDAKSKPRPSWQPMQCWSSSSNHGRGSEEEEEQNARDIAKELEGVLQSDESRALLEDLDEAVRRVERARKELESLDNSERRDEQVVAEVERRIRDEFMEQQAVVEECEAEVAAAEAETRAARAALVGLRAGQLGLDEKYQELERIESVKAAAVASLGGAFSSLPFLLADYSTGSAVGTLVASEATVVLSCALFGVCYRYIVRRDLENVQLKSGSAAAFALARGLGLLDALQREHPDRDSLLLATVYLGQSAAIFLSAALALDLCLQSEAVKPFPRQDKV